MILSSIKTQPFPIFLNYTVHILITNASSTTMDVDQRKCICFLSDDHSALLICSWRTSREPGHGYQLIHPYRTLHRVVHLVVLHTCQQSDLDLKHQAEFNAYAGKHCSGWGWNPPQLRLVTSLKLSHRSLLWQEMLWFSG